MAGRQIPVTLGDITWSLTFESRKEPHLEVESMVPGAAVVLCSENTNLKTVRAFLGQNIMEKSLCMASLTFLV